MDDQLRQRERRWAIVRIVMGTLQVVGSVTTLLLLLATGVNSLTICAGLALVCLIIGSRLLFGFRQSETSN